MGNTKNVLIYPTIETMTFLLPLKKKKQNKMALDVIKINKMNPILHPPNRKRKPSNFLIL